MHIRPNLCVFEFYPLYNAHPYQGNPPQFTVIIIVMLIIIVILASNPPPTIPPLRPSSYPTLYNSTRHIKWYHRRSERTNPLHRITVARKLIYIQIQVLLRQCFGGRFAYIFVHRDLWGKRKAFKSNKCTWLWLCADCNNNNNHQWKTRLFQSDYVELTRYDLDIFFDKHRWPFVYYLRSQVHCCFRHLLIHRDEEWCPQLKCHE